MGNIGYDTKKNGEDILSRQRQLLSTIWMKFVPVAPRYLEFRFGVKKFAFELAKVPDLANPHSLQPLFIGSYSYWIMYYLSKDLEKSH